MDGLAGERMSIIRHLEELRRRILACLAFFLVMTICSFVFVEKLVYILQLPAKGVIPNFVFVTPTEVFTSYVKVALLSGFVMSLIFIIIQTGLFLRPALPDEKRKSIGIWLGMAFLLAILGILFSYFLALPFALKFLISFASKSAIPMISIGQYLSFTGALILAGAGIFQIPVAIAFLSEIGIVKNSFLRKNRKYVLILILIISALITPTQDIINMLVFSLPMYCLYEVGIIISGVIEKRRIKNGREYI